MKQTSRYELMIFTMFLSSNYMITQATKIRFFILELLCNLNLKC